jgi:hypothetical protein
LNGLRQAGVEAPGLSAVLIDFFKQLIADSVVNQPDYPGYASACEK